MDRRRFVGLALGAAALAACGAPPAAGRAAGTWRPIAAAGAPPPGGGQVAFWTGREMLVLSGRGGGRYDPAADRWRPIAAASAPRASGSAPLAAAWTGRELLVWDGLVGVGARYDPSADRWAPMAARDAPSPRTGARLVWTGAEALLFGGVEVGGPGRSRSRPSARTGGRYDPATDSWRPAAASDLPHPGFAAVWTGQEVLAWGGIAKADVALPGAAYDPAADRWRRLPTAGEPFRRTNHALLWTGGLVVVVGGFGNRHAAGPAPPLDGGAYEPSTDRWLPLGTAGAPAGRTRATAVWAGREVLVWGGENRHWPGGGVLGDGAAGDPAAGTWRPLPADGAPSPRYGHVAVWTGREMLVWGGYGAGAPQPWLADGAAYRPG